MGKKIKANTSRGKNQDIKKKREEGRGKREIELEKGGGRGEAEGFHSVSVPYVL